MRYVVSMLIVLLIVLYQDNWLWDDPTLVGGILPVGLVYHMGISVAAAAVWLLAAIYCWPKELEENAPQEGGRQP